VVVDGKVIETDGKIENAQHLPTLDPFTLAVLKAHVEMLDRECKDSGRRNDRQIMTRPCPRCSLT
jgi:hypothetical protein